MGNPDGTDEGDGSSLAMEKRQRAKQACEPCRLRKRRCDGAMPCNMCRQFEYKCYFEKHPRKRSKLVEQNAHRELSPDFIRPEPPQADRPTAEDTLKAKSMEAASAFAFTRFLGQRLDPSFGPTISTSAWNLGTAVYDPPAVTPITEYLTQDQMYTLAQIHFENVHRFYGFLDKDWILQQIGMRWLQPQHCSIPDHLLGNIAVLASLFSGGAFSPGLPLVLESAKKALEATSLMRPPTILDVQSWILRCLYLRATDHPHACHTATCITMYLVEAIGLHQETSTPTQHAAHGGFPSPEIRRRTFWSARMLNTWVSFEHGRGRMTHRGITTQVPSPQEGDYTLDNVNLYALCFYLDPEQSDLQLGDFLRHLDEFEAKNDVIELSKANLALCGYRRIRTSNPTPSSEIISRVIKIGLSGSEAARRLCAKGMPWWHMANVPFQALCVFLAIDTRESLSHVATIMQVLQTVVERFPTTAMKETLKTVRFLIKLSKRRKNEDANVLDQALTSVTENIPASLNDPIPDPAQDTVNGLATLPQGALPAAGSEDWMFDAINNSDFDWNYFLTADMPAFNTLVPDGSS